MKKILFLMLGAFAALASCQKESVPSGSGQEVAITVAASLPTPQTKTKASNEGGIDNVDWSKVSLRYTLEVYDNSNGSLVPIETDGETQRILYRTEQTGAKTVSFDNVRLLLGKKYQFVIWADFVNKDKTELHYTTANSLRKITEMNQMTRKGNDDSRDAYFATEEVTVDGSVTKNISLKRPFGKIRVITTDVKSIPGITSDTEVRVKWTSSVASGLDAYTGALLAGTDTTPAEYTTTVGELTEREATLAFDYFFAEPTSTGVPVQKPIDFRLSCLSANFEMKTQSVKIERNKLTTVKGNLLTGRVIASVSINDEFDDPSIDFNIPEEVATIADLQERLNDAASEVGAFLNVKVKSVVTEDVTVTIPQEVTATNTPKINLDFSAGISPNKTLTIAGENDSFAGEMHVSVPESSEAALVINMPKATLYVNGEMKTLNATVAPNTLVIEKGAVIGTLTLNKGNLTIYGAVDNLAFGQSLFDDNTVIDRMDLNDIEAKGTIITCVGLHTQFASDLVGIKADSIPNVVYFHYYLNNDDFTNILFLPQFSKTIRMDAAEYPSQSRKAVARNSANIEITQPMVINGGSAGRVYSFSEAGGFTLKATTTLRNVTIDGANSVGKAPLTIAAEGVTLIGDNLTLNQTTSGNGDGTANSGLGIKVEPRADINNVTIDLVNSNLNMNGQRGYQRAIVFPTSIPQTGMVVTMTNSTVKCLTATNMPSATYSQGVGLGALVNPKITLNNCLFEGMYYAINNSGDTPTNMELTINGCRMSAFGVLNLRGSSTINILNGSVLTGCNPNPAGSNDFATIVYNRNEMKDISNLTIDNSTIQNYVTSTSTEHLIDIRGNQGINITLKNKTILKDETVLPDVKLDYMIKEKGLECTITDDGTTVLIGKDGVRLVE